MYGGEIGQNRAESGSWGCKRAKTSEFRRFSAFRGGARGAEGAAQWQNSWSHADIGMRVFDKKIKVNLYIFWVYIIPGIIAIFKI